MAKLSAVKKQGEAERVDPFTEVGRPGLRQWNGYIEEEFLTELRSDKGRRVYREMSENHPVIGAVLNVIEMFLRQVSVRVERGGTSPQDDAAYDFVEECLNDTEHTWEDFVTEVLTMLVYGWSIAETVYKKRDDGRIGWKKFACRSQLSLDRWEFDDEQNLLAFIQTPAPDYQERRIPIEKCLLFRTRVIAGNPEGHSLLRRAYVSWYTQKHLQFVESIGIERDLAGLPVAKVPVEWLTASTGSAEATILAGLKDVVTRIRRDEQEGLIMPLAYDSSGNETVKFELLSTAGSRQLDVSKTIERYDQRLAQTLLGDFVLLGHEKVGSFALASSKTSTFSIAIAGWLDSVLATFNKHAILPLLELNGIRTDDPPRLMRGDIETPDLAEVGQYITSLAGAGMPLFPDPALEQHLRSVAHLPDLGAEAETVGKRQKQQPLNEAIAALIHELRRIRGKEDGG